MARNKKLPLTETTYYVLLALLKPAHGYVIMQEVEELSKGTVKMAAGTMYGSIENLLKLKYIKQIDSEDSRRKVYTITDEGKSILKQQFERYEHMIQITTARLDGESSE
jgi:DNA-binding PadR family transcriptional regulator